MQQEKKTLPHVEKLPAKTLNRRQRRAALRNKPFIGNGKQLPLTISGVMKYVRRIQEIKLPNGSIKRIKHYVLRDRI